MSRLTPQDITQLLLALALMLGMARLFSEVFTRLRQPAIVGEILAGIVLGPSLLGAIAPELMGSLFPTTGASAVALDTINTLAVVLLLLVAGMEVDLSVLWRQGRAALMVSVLGMIIPFGIGAGLAWLVPEFLGAGAGVESLTFALFFGIALSISALPVIAKILFDLGLFKSDIGMLIMAAAMFDDLVGWMGFSVVLGKMSAESGSGHEGSFGVGATIVLTILIAATTLTIGRYLVHRVLPWIQARLSWPGGVIGFVLVLALSAAAATEAIGIHAIFGGFLAGVAIGDSAHLREQTRVILHQFVANVFAPIFFVSIGLRVNFLANFDLVLVLVVLAIAFIAKLAGCYSGARLGGLTRSEGWAIGFGMNARGAMEIILGLLALQFGIISDELFVALVVLALVSSIVSGPMMNRFVRRPKSWALEDLLSLERIVDLDGATDAESAIALLAQDVAQRTGIPLAVIERAAIARERQIGSGIGNEIAIPYARLEAIEAPVLALGHSSVGIDFDSPDGALSHLVALVLTGEPDDGAHVRIMAQIGRGFRTEEARTMVYQRQPANVIRAFIKIQAAAHAHA
ncbi:MAG TPA: cation:proton antiporter [Candidatus Kapabacteria bacterium]|nr:cation:proton antiporter [Candidatus Kapabacteria bacterium]